MRIETLSMLVVTLLFAGCGKQPATPDSDSSAKSNDAAAQSDSVESAPPSGHESTGSAEAVAAKEQQTESTNHEPDDHGPGMGRGMGGPGRGMGRGMGRGGGFRPDMTTIHAMFAVKEKIKRTVKPLPTGAEAITESDDEEIASLIQEHVPAMESRVLENSPLPPMTFHPVFQELIKHSEDYTLEYEDTDKGIKVTYKAEDPFVIMLVQEHSKLVSRFLKNGMSEIHKPYELPTLKDGDKPPVPPKDAAKSKAGAAIERLRDGNSRFVADKSIHPHDARSWRDKLSTAQHPFAVVVGCSDSRVPPELVFDQGLGDLFVIRVAGNVVDADVAGSVEYAIDHLDTKLVVVLGHSNCGAVTAAIEHAKGKLEHEPAEIVSLIKHIEPAIHCDEDCPHDQLISESVQHNVEQSVRQLSKVDDVNRAILNRDVQVVGAIYDMESGKVGFLDQQPGTAK